jgi:hypothetical protein
MGLRDGLRDFLRIPKHRRKHSKARSDTNSIESPNEPDPAVPRPTEPTQDLQIGSSTLPTSSPLIPRDQESSGTRITLLRAIYLTIPSCNVGDRDPTRSVPSERHLGSSNCIVDPTAAHENNSNWMSTAYSAAKLAINMIKESSDVFPPLKSVAGGLSAILQHCDVRSTSSMSPHPRRLPSSQQTMACRQTIESLVPRVEGLAESLSAPAPEGEVKEEKRRTALKL